MVKFVRMNSHQPFTYDGFIEQFSEAKNKANQLVKGRYKKSLTKKPDPSRWSAAECLQHLLQFGNIYYDNMNQRLERAEGNSASPGTVFKPRFHFKIVNKYLEPPYNLKVKTVAPFEPENVSDENVEDILNQFSDLQEGFIGQLKRCRQQGVDLHTVRISNPVVSFVKMTLADCYSLIAVHQRRHLWQAGQTFKLQDAGTGRGLTVE